MRKKLLITAFLGFSFPLGAEAAAPSVAVDIAPLHSLVSQVMEGVSEPNLLIPAEASPHGYKLRPSQAKALSDADVVFWMGETLTPWLEKALDNVADSAKKVEMLGLEKTISHDFREGATFEKHEHHEEEGHEEEGHDDDKHDEHADKKEDKHHDEKKEEHHDEKEEHHEEDEHHDHDGKDPHAWLDPQNAKIWVTVIRNTLSKQDPENAAVYAKNADAATASLDALIASTTKEIKDLGELKFIVFHDAYQYFEKRFDIAAAGAISLGDAEDPSPKRIQEIRDTVKNWNVNCVFTEPQYNAGLVNNVFEKTSISTVAVMDPLGASIPAGSQHYAALIKGMVNSLSQCNK